MAGLNKLSIFVVILIFLIGLTSYYYFKERLIPAPGVSNEEGVETKAASSPEPTKTQKKFVEIATGLDIPWSLVFLPDDSMFFTERGGKIKMIDKRGKILEKAVGIVKDVHAVGEGGLLGIEISPEFNKNKYVFVYYTYQSLGKNTLNRVTRFKFVNNFLTDEKIIVDKIPGGTFHNGGRIKFGPDKYLYITTGDGGEPSLSQNKTSLAGKILRVDENGKVPDGNPFSNPVFSYGHRNPQGLAWDKRKKLWETEHGSVTLDEVNLIEPGKNYGWPIIRGNEQKTGILKPDLNSGKDTWAPSGTAILHDSLFFGGLRGEALYEVDLNSNPLTLKTHLKGELGRIRDVVIGPDKMIYLLTSNTDGRGEPNVGDDKIVKLDPANL